MKRGDPLMVNFLEQFAQTIAPKASEASVNDFIHAVERVSNAKEMEQLAQTLKFALRDDIINAEGLVPQANPGKRLKISLRNTKKAMERRRLLKEWRSTINKLKLPLRRVGEGQLHNGTLHDAFGLLARTLKKVWAAELRAAEQRRAMFRAAVHHETLSNGSISSRSGDGQGNVIVENMAAVNGPDNYDGETEGDNNSHDDSRQEQA
ncbi:MAG: hypothetical protein SGARI_006979 [Bacillariaceae sp.]